MKNQILERIEKIKADEEGFTTEWWKNNFVSYTELQRTSDKPVAHDKIVSITKHISEVDFKCLNDDDLVRLFEAVILMRADAVTRRVQQTYLNPDWTALKYT